MVGERDVTVIRQYCPRSYIPNDKIQLNDEPLTSIKFLRVTPARKFSLSQIGNWLSGQSCAFDLLYFEYNPIPRFIVPLFQEPIPMNSRAYYSTRSPIKLIHSFPSKPEVVVRNLTRRNECRGLLPASLPVLGACIA